MRIACLDASAAERLALQEFLDSCFSQCRSAVGHLEVHETFPAGDDELLLSSPPDVVAIGPAYGPEEAYKLGRSLRESLPGVSLLIFLESEQYTLRLLRRFQRLSAEVFTLSEDPVRIVHYLSCLAAGKEELSKGKLIAVKGVKGGVGTTSIVSGLAHAAEALGEQAVVLDLSLHSSFAFYMSAARRQSADFGSALMEGVTPDKALLERCLTKAPNGISLLLPPAGGTETRELWLRSPSHFEFTLNAVEVLKQMFDLVLVDLAAAEGVMPFALLCRADTRLLVSSNDPASVHLLGNAVQAAVDAPSEGSLQVLVNLLVERGLTYDDVLDFLYCQASFSPEMAALDAVAYDSRARGWIGTGNSFYTEASGHTQKLFEKTLAALLLSPEERSALQRKRRSLLARFFDFSAPQRKKIEGGRQALPLLTEPSQQQEPNQAEIQAPLRPLSPQGAGTQEESRSVSTSDEPQLLYEPPRVRVNE